MSHEPSQVAAIRSVLCYRTGGPRHSDDEKPTYTKTSRYLFGLDQQLGDYARIDLTDLPTARSCSSFLFPRRAPGFDGVDAVYKRLFQNALADGPEYESEQSSLEVLAVAYD